MSGNRGRALWGITLKRQNENHWLPLLDWSYKLFTQKFPWLFSNISKPHFSLRSFCCRVCMKESLCLCPVSCFCIHSFHKEIVSFWPPPATAFGVLFHVKKPSTLKSWPDHFRILRHWAANWLPFSVPDCPCLSNRDPNSAYLIWWQTEDGESGFTFQERRNAVGTRLRFCVCAFFPKGFYIHDLTVSSC